MRSKLLRGLVAATLAVTIGAVGLAPPARADVPGDVTYPPAGPTVTLFFSLWRVFRGGLSSGEVEQLIQMAIGAVTQAENETISQIDGLAAARAKGDAVALGREFLNYPVIRQSWALYTFASNANRSAALDYQDLQVVSDLKAADGIGHALTVVYPLALTAAKDSGWTQAALVSLQNEYRAAIELAVRKLEPRCTIADAPLAPPSTWAVERRFDCQAADGNRVTATELYLGGVRQGAAVNVDQLKVNAAVRSSWLTAVRVLPTLQTP